MNKGLNNGTADLRTTFNSLKRAYQQQPYPSLEQRKALLVTLKQAILDNEQTIYTAFKQDFGYRSELTSLTAELIPSVRGINYAVKHLKKWMKDSRRKAGMYLFPSSVKVQYQPLGVVGIISPWNFPVLLALSPLIEALAAGNRVMLKLSEFTPHINSVMRTILDDLSDHVQVVEGDSEVGAAFSRLPFDHLLFTGSTVVGRKVAHAAAENLTPVTLELGGKSPALLTRDSDLDYAVDVIISAKTMNAGQVCIAPDYLLLPEGMEQELIQRYQQKFKDYFLSHDNDNRLDFIISDQQLARIESLLKDAQEKGAKLHPVEQHKRAGDSRLMYPVILTQVDDAMTVMNEEIFGPILPLVTYSEVEAAIDYINARPRPLALYIMSQDQTMVDHVLRHTHSGGVAINDAVAHAAVDDAPFGGIGHSGMGHYHGKEGFLRFSHAKTVLTSKPWIPKYRFMLKYPEKMYKMLRKQFLR